MMVATAISKRMMMMQATNISSRNMYFLEKKTGNKQDSVKMCIDENVYT